MGAIISAPLMVIGEKLGLYRAMAGAGPLSSEDVAKRSGASERYVREWLANQAAGGYVAYDPETDRFTLPDEHALALADEESPLYVLGAFESIASLYADEDKDPRGVSYRRRDGLARARPTPLHAGPSASSAPATARTSSSEWIPALDGVAGEARAGRERRRRRLRPRRVDSADGGSVPASRSSTASTTTRRRSSAPARRERSRRRRACALRCRRRPRSIPGAGYDLVCVFDCLHDMGDPVGASAHVLETLAPMAHG